MKTSCTIVKIGGGIVNDKNALYDFLKIFSSLDSPKVLVHGGGNIASEMTRKLGHDVEFINGRRVTNEAGLEVATMVYAGLINTSICASLSQLKCTSIGLSGVDGNVIESTKRPSEPVDYGFAGDIQKVNGDVLNVFIDSGLCPVMCSITHNGLGQLLNTNADTIAAEVGIALSEFYAVDLIYCFEKPGVLMNPSDSNSVIDQLSFNQYITLQEEKIVSEGMLPKLDNCFHALKNGVVTARIGDVEIMEGKSAGTEILVEL